MPRAAVVGGLFGVPVGVLWGWLAYGSFEPGFMAAHVVSAAAIFAAVAVVGVAILRQLRGRAYGPALAGPISTDQTAVPGNGRRSEMLVFLILAVVIWPFIAVAVVGGFGFLVWMWQMVFGPPGPPM